MHPRLPPLVFRPETTRKREENSMFRVGQAQKIPCGMLEMAAVHMEASRATYAAPVKVGALPRVVGVNACAPSRVGVALFSGLRATLVAVGIW